MHENPVRRGLVRSPGEWRWSSYRAYGYEEHGPVLVNERQPVQLKWKSWALPTLSLILTPEGAPSLCLRFLQTQGGGFDFLLPLPFTSFPASAPSTATQFPPLLQRLKYSDENCSMPNPLGSRPDRA